MTNTNKPSIPSALKFIKMANHAIRTQMTVVSGSLSLLEMLDTNERQRQEMIAKASNRSKDASQLMTDLMMIGEYYFLDPSDYSKREEFLNELMIEVIEGFENVEYEECTEEILIIVNVNDFVRAIRRQLSASLRWGKVRIEVSRNDTQACIRLFDQGPKIEQNHEELFEEFHSFKGRGIEGDFLTHICSRVLLRFNETSIDFVQVDDLAMTEFCIGVEPE